MKPILAACLLTLLSACQAKPGVEASAQSATESAADMAAATTEFPYPAIPPALTDIGERKAYLLEHYWSGFDFADSLLVDNRNVTEQGAADFLALLAGDDVTEAVAETAFRNMCTRMASHVHAREVMSQIMDSYLYDPNSPYYNERLYGAYLRCMIELDKAEGGMEGALSFRLRLIGRNNPGAEAEDFTYFLPGGERRSLRTTKIDGSHLLLLFYDPECPTCHDVLGQMSSDRALADAVSGHKLTVLAIYTEGDEDAWRRSLHEMPAGWVTGQDRQQVQDNALYDLKAMPSLYLLDKDKKVLLKDAQYTAIRDYIGLK